MNAYRHIIWDWNGTLLNDVAVCVAVLNELLARRRMPGLTLDRYRAEFDFPVQGFYETLGFDFSRVDYNHLAEDYIACYRRRQFDCRLHDQASRTLQTLQTAGLGQSILSAYRRDLLQEAVRSFGIASFFAHVHGLDNHHAADKTALGLGLVDRLDVPPDRILIIGDTTHDADVAETLGLGCLLVAGGHQAASRLQARGLPMVSGLAAIPRFLGLAEG